MPLLDEHFIYSRLHLEPQVARLLLDRDGQIGRKNAEGAVDVVFYKYAKNREDAEELVAGLKAVRAVLHVIGQDLEKFLDCFDFSKPGGVAQSECDRDD